MEYYGYKDFCGDMKKLLSDLDFAPDCIVAISRGGLTMAHFLGNALDLRRVYAISAISYFNRQKESLQISNIPELYDAQRVLIVDEIIDSGTSMHKICEILTGINPEIDFKTACIFYKKTAQFLPDFYVRECNSWIEFFWEVDLIKEVNEKH